MRETFLGLNGDLTEGCEQQYEPTFTANGQAFRQVTNRNTPSIINAIFYVRQFWDGRANAWFNGANSSGPVDTGARVWKLNPKTGVPSQVQINIDHASLASQAVGPVNSAVEMAAHGRGWVDVARKPALNQGALNPEGQSERQHPRHICRARRWAHTALRRDDQRRVSAPLALECPGFSRRIDD